MKLNLITFFTSVLVLAFTLPTISQTSNETPEESGLGAWLVSVMGGDEDSSFVDYIDDSCGIKLDLVAVEGGSFEMGCTGEQDNCGIDEQPAHEVIVDDFYMSRYEVTNEQFCAFLNSVDLEANALKNGKQLIALDQKFSQIHFVNGQFVPEAGMGNYPVVEVSWFGAVAFCKWAGGRLPTEAEWEYAARGGVKSEGYLYSGGNGLDEVAWHYDNSQRDLSSGFYENHGTMPVGLKKPNELGIYDMTGNVFEWCSDRYNRDYYGYSPTHNPTGPESGYSRVLRGGSWGDEPKACRVSYRVSVGEYTNYFMYGFRFVKDRK